MRLRLTVIAVLLLSLSGCFVSDKLSNQNLSYLYKSGVNFLHPEYTLYHFSTDSTRVYYKINTDELLYTRQEDQKFGAVFKISYRLFGNVESQIATDTGSVQLTDSRMDETTNLLIGHFDCKSANCVSGTLELRLTDLNRKQFALNFLSIDKSTPQTAQFFLMTHKNSEEPYFDNYIAASDSVRIRHRDAGVHKFYVKYFKRSFPIAVPPFAIENLKAFDYVADSSFIIDLAKNTALCLPGEGLYHVQSDSSGREGFTIFRFKSDFPEVSKIDQLLEPLRYITSHKEYDDLVGASNQKLALDKFWVNLAGNQERARELIRRFYTRVMNANILFTSYLEGWKTDRGIIYIVFGAPNVVYRGENSENWTYGETGAMLSLSFSFIKVRNPFTLNDFMLNRAPLYETSWYRAVDTWRQGRVYSD